METEPDTVTAMLGDGPAAAAPRDVALLAVRTWRRRRHAARSGADLDVGAAAEWIFRMVLSVATIPGESFDADDPDQLAAFFAAHLVRGLA